ncbi:zinc knuckle domain-containing protein [Cordyceps javanica]|uniref:Zinc knuckle domain-containing protein n=1 Tax=Cordyceps javanica TaxID=43265 RepID=A0A545WD08_9HYPO|nr:zinc knuckle domain-containing protein [Cordyceps javanica]TQW11877.1 zinc knuckle domain-containing protein [Cordyceps javanica]
MYSYRGGPSRSTPANATAQERPYVSRPSRTQQLRNPKLVPKLTNDAPNSLERKKGAADEELSRKAAERERERALEGRDEESDEPLHRPRSLSADSVSTVSTNARGRSVSPPRRSRRRYGSKNGEEAGEIAESPNRRQPSRSRSPHRSGEELETINTDRGRHGRQVTKKTGIADTEIAKTIVVDDKIPILEVMLENAASAPSVNG